MCLRVSLPGQSLTTTGCRHRQGGAETAERKAALDEIFAVVEPYGSDVIDTRELFFWLSKGVHVHNDAEARLQFFVSL